MYHHTRVYEKECQTYGARNDLRLAAAKEPSFDVFKCVRIDDLLMLRYRGETLVSLFKWRPKRIEKSKPASLKGGKHETKG